MSSVCSLRVGRTHYYVHGYKKALKQISKVNGLQYDQIESVKMNPYNGIIKVWKIGELIEELRR